jgi:hypothetical protein
MVPSPVKAVLLLFPITQAIEAKRKEEDETIKAQASSSFPLSPVIWIKQTVGSIAPIVFTILRDSLDFQRLWDHWTLTLAGKRKFLLNFFLFHRYPEFVMLADDGEMLMAQQTGVKFTPGSPLAEFVEACKGVISL